MNPKFECPQALHFLAGVVDSEHSGTVDLVGFQVWTTTKDKYTKPKGIRPIFY